VKSINGNVMLLQQFLPATRQISREFLSTNQIVRRRTKVELF